MSTSGTEWVSEEMQMLEALYHQCQEKELTLLAEYCICLKRLLNGIVQLKNSELYRYERNIFEKPVRLFVSHFQQQTERILSYEREREHNMEVILKSGIEAADPLAQKEILDEEKRLLDDISASVSEFSQVYQSMVSNKLNIDRQMASGLAVNTMVYKTSPKWGSFYNRFLNCILEMFPDDEGKYAFIVYPSLEPNIKVHKLFESRDVSGKVAVLYVPAHQMERATENCVCLAHEAFHIITKNLKMLKLRATMNIGQMAEVTKQAIFDGVRFPMIQKADGNDSDMADVIKEKLIRKWLGELFRTKEYFLGCTDTRELYSNEFSKKLAEVFADSIDANCRNVYEDWISACMEAGFFECVETEYGNYYERGKWAANAARIIESNLRTLLKEGFFEECSLLLNDVYKESYADIACIQLLGLTYDEYEQTFEKSVSIKGLCNVYDPVMEMRKAVVTSAIAGLEPEGSNSFIETWKKPRMESEGNVQKHSRYALVQGKRGGGAASGLAGTEYKMPVTKLVMRNFEIYTGECAKKVQADFADRNPDAVQSMFGRIKCKDDGNGETENALLEILGGY